MPLILFLGILNFETAAKPSLIALASCAEVAEKHIVSILRVEEKAESSACYLLAR
jgi:hypothetical protein